MYKCKKLGKLCGNKEPIDQFVSVGSTLLTAKTYQRCTSCPLFEARIAAIQKPASTQASTPDQQPSTAREPGEPPAPSQP